MGRSTRAHRVRAWIPKTGGGSSSSEHMQLEASLGYKNCGSNVTESLCNLQWCADCRNKLADRNFSTWATVTFGLVVVLLLVARTPFYSPLKAGIAFERGCRAESAGDYSKGVTEYRTAAERFPDSTLAQARLGIVIIDPDDTPKPQLRSKEFKIVRQQAS